jgi:TPR repeat protein
MARLDFYASGMSAGTPATMAVDALYELGLMHCTGRDGAVDLVESHKWLNLAAMRGSADAKRLRLELASEMTRAEISRAQRLAREWLARQ